MDVKPLVDRIGNEEANILARQWTIMRGDSNNLPLPKCQINGIVLNENSYKAWQAG